MSLIKELAKENLLFIALQGCRAVLEKELDIPSVVFSMSSNVRQEIVRRSRETELKFPYSYLTLTSLAAVKELQNNYAVQKHGLRFNHAGQRATTTKGYLFPITLGLDFHYIDSDPIKILAMSQALVLLSVNKGLSFQIDVGDIFSFVVDLEIPLETTINISESNEPSLPGASDVNVQIVMHTTIGFFRDVSAVNGPSATLGIKVSGSDSFKMDLQLP
jgi:hypothetical protein